MSDLDFQADETIEEETIIHRKRIKRTIRPEPAAPRSVQAVIDATPQMNKAKAKQLPAAKQDTPEMRSRALPPSSAKTPQQQRLTKIFNLTRGTVGRKVDSDELTAFAETKTLATLAYALTHEKSVTKVAANTLFMQAVQTLYHVPVGRNIPIAVLKRDWNESLARLSERRPLTRAELSAAEARGLDAVARIKDIPAQFVLSDEIHNLLDTTPERLFTDIYRKRHAGKEPQTQEDVFHDAEVQRYYRALRRIDNGDGIGQSWRAFKEDWNEPIAQVVLKPALPSDARLKETRRRVAQLNAQKAVWSRQNKELRNQLFKPVPTTAGGKTLEKLIEENSALWERTETERDVWTKRNNTLRDQLNQSAVKASPTQTLKDMKAENASLKETLAKAQQGQVRSAVRKNERQNLKKHQDKIRFLDENRDNHTVPGYLPTAMPTVFDVDATWNEMDREEEQARLDAMEQSRDNHDVPSFLPNAAGDGRFDVDAVWDEMDREETFQARLDEVERRNLVVPEAAAANLTNTELRDVHDYQDIEDKINQKREQERHEKEAAFQAHLDEVERRNLVVPEAAAANLINTELRDVHDYQDIEDKINRKRAKIQPPAVRPKAPNTSFTFTVTPNPSDTFAVTPKPEPIPTPSPAPKPEPVQPDPKLLPEPPQERDKGDESLRRYYEVDVYRNALFKATDYEPTGNDNQDFPHFCHYWKKPLKTYLSEINAGSNERDAYNDTTRTKLNDLLRGKNPSLLGPAALHKNYEKTMGDIILSVPLNQHNALKKWLAVAAVAGTVSIATLVALFSIGKKDKQETRVAQAAPTHQTAPKPAVKQAAPVTNTPKIVRVNTERAPYPYMTGTQVVQANWSAFHRDQIGGAKIPQYGKDKVILENEYNFFLEVMKRNNIGIADAIADKSAAQQLLGPKVSIYTVDGTIVDQFSVDNVDACAEMIDHYRHNLKTVLSGMKPDQQIKYMSAVGPSIGLSTFQQETWQKLHPNEAAQALKIISADVRDRQLSNPELSLFDATVDAIADFRETHPDNQALSLTGYQVISRYQAQQQVQTASRDNTVPMDNPADNSPEQPEKSSSNTGKKLAWTTAAAGIVAGIVYNRIKKEK